MCYICKNEGLIPLYKSTTMLVEKEKNNPKLLNLTFSDYLDYKIYVSSQKSRIKTQEEFDYFVHKMALNKATRYKFKNQMNMIIDKPCSTEHADMIELLAQRKLIAIKPRGDELVGSIESWGNDWRNGF